VESRRVWRTQRQSTTQREQQGHRVTSAAAAAAAAALQLRQHRRHKVCINVAGIAPLESQKRWNMEQQTRCRDRNAAAAEGHAGKAGTLPGQVGTHLRDGSSLRDVPHQRVSVLARGHDEALVPRAPVHAEDALRVAHQLAEGRGGGGAQIPQLQGDRHGGSRRDRHERSGGAVMGDGRRELVSAASKQACPPSRPDVEQVALWDCHVPCGCC